MQNHANIPGFLTTAQAAQVAGLTAHRIGCLVRAGEIDGVKAGNTLLVDAASLNRYAQANQGKGRPMDVETAFGALWLLSGLDVDWLSYARERRLRNRLKAISAEQLSWQLRKRAEVHRYRVSDSFTDGLVKRLVLSGANTAALRDIGLLPRKGAVEGYCHANDLDDIERSFFLVNDSSGNVAIRVSRWLPEGVKDEMPVAVAAADLAQSLDTREREAGLSMLERLQDEFRKL